MRLFGELTKIEEQPDGSLKVYGVASTGARDEAGEVVLPAAMKAALPDYARYPALREMHQPTAAGRTLEATVDDDGATRIVAQVVDPVAIAKVKSRTYAGFSIGGRVIARDPADATIITKIKLSEISLVDRPANPEAVIDLWKAAAAAPSNEAVKSFAADLAIAAGRPGDGSQDSGPRGRAIPRAHRRHLVREDRGRADRTGRRVREVRRLGIPQRERHSGCLVRFRRQSHRRVDQREPASLAVGYVSRRRRSIPWMVSQLSAGGRGAQGRRAVPRLGHQRLDPRR
jgi:HK97 family phage prohead protease